MNEVIEYIIDNEEFQIENNTMILKENNKNNKIIKCYKSFDNIDSIIAEKLNIIKINKEFWLNFTNLININLNDNKIFKFPKSIFDLSNLNKLSLNNNLITLIPHNISQLKTLEYFSINNNKIELIPNPLIKLINLNYLDISYNQIKELPIELGLMKSLNSLKIIGNKIEKLPTALSQLSQLKEIEFEWFNYINNDPNIIYNKTLSLFKSLFNKKQLYCDFNEFIEKLNDNDEIDYTLILYSSIQNNFIGLVKILSNNSEKYKINLIQKYKDKKPPLLHALSLSENINEKIPKIIFKNLNLELFSNNEKFNYLTKAIRKKNIYLIKEILKTIKDENELINDSQMTPFHYIFANFDNELAKSKIIANLFFNKCSNKILNHISNEGWGAIHVATRRQSYECLKWIIHQNKNNKSKKQFLINLKGKENWTPLHLSLNTNNIQITKLLIENGGNVFNRTTWNKTPRNVCSQNDIPNLISKLLISEEEKYLYQKYNNNDKKYEIVKKNKKSINYNPSRANINYYKDTFVNKDSSLFEICETINNLSFSLLTPIVKKYSNEDIALFIEKTISSFDLSLNNKKNYLCISAFSNLSICLKNNLIIKVYNNFLKKEKICDIIKNDMLNCIEILSKINPLHSKTLKMNNAAKFPINKNKKKNMNIINIKNVKQQNKKLNEDDSMENISNSEMKSQRSITNVSNESCNILDSSASISQISHYDGLNQITKK